MATTSATAETNGKGKGVELVQLPPIRVVRTMVKVVGTSTLITHAWSEKAKREMKEKQEKKARTAKEARNPEAEYLAARYIDEKDQHCVPAIAFKSAIVSAARFADDLKMTVLRGAIFVVGDRLPLNYERVVMREDMVRIGMGTADLRYRPEYFGWSVDLPIEFNSQVLSAAQVLHLIKLAGFAVGICEWRPERDGQHGRFDVAEGDLA